MKKTSLLFFLLPLFFGCSDQEGKKPAETPAPATAADSVQTVQKTASKPADAATILSRKQVPVLCYHHIKDLQPGQSKRMLGYTVPVALFREQIKSLADSGYKTITPDDYLNYLNTGTGLPEKPVMISFDDTDEEQYTIGATELNKYGFKGVYFMMTISIGRPRYMNKQQIRDLADNGHIIACHTWDHNNVKKYGEGDWDKQFLEPRKKLEEISGKPVEHFAYPFGLWKPEAIPELKKRGYKSAYQLSPNKRDSTDPAFTLRRMIVPGDWGAASMHKWMKITFR